MAALADDFTQQHQRDQANQIRQRARFFAALLSQEKTCCTRRSAPSVPLPATWSNWSGSCARVRPQHVMGHAGQQAAYQSR